MLKNFDNTLKADLCKKNSFKNELEFSNYNLESCMVILLVILVLLLYVISVAAAPNPNFMVGI